MTVDPIVHKIHHVYILLVKIWHCKLTGDEVECKFACGIGMLLEVWDSCTLDGMANH